MKWNKKQEEKLKRLYPGFGPRKTAKKMNLSYDQVNSKAKRLGVNFNFKVQPLMRQDKPDWYKYGRMGFLDIEMTQLKADFGVILSVAIKDRNGNVWVDTVTADDIKKGIFDKRVIANAINEMRNYDIIVTYYGTVFDIPSLRTRSLYWRDEPDVPAFPSYGEICHIDLYYQVRSKTNLHSNRLDAVAKFLKLGKQKTEVDPEIWFRAAAGDMSGMEYIRKHNIIDVEVLEEAYRIIEPYFKGTKKSI